MPTNAQNVGRDVSIDVVSANGQVRRFPIRTGFSSKQDTVAIKTKGADGRLYFAELPDGWSGSLDFERASSALDDYFAATEEDYYAGRNLDVLSITETIREVNGAVTQWRYTNVAMKYDDAGSKTGDATIKQKVSWMADRRRKIA